jgi:hypothetical protein
MQVVWPSAEDPAPAFVASFELGEGESAHIFGTRYDIAGALFEGDPLGDGHVIEYFVVTGRPSTWQCRRLMQHEDVVYSQPRDPIGHVPAAQVDAAVNSVRNPPRWTSRSSAIWPTDAGEPMLFLGQVATRENEATAAACTSGTLYLFRSHQPEDRFTLVDQETSEQSVEEHYAVEEEFDS